MPAVTASPKEKRFIDRLWRLRIKRWKMEGAKGYKPKQVNVVDDLIERAKDHPLTKEELPQDNA